MYKLTCLNLFKSYVILYKTVDVLPLSGQFNLSILILGKPGTCEKYGMFQCNNGKCVLKDRICNSKNECGDNSDELKRDGTFCGTFS